MKTEVSTEVFLRGINTEVYRIAPREGRRVLASVPSETSRSLSSGRKHDVFLFSLLLEPEKKALGVKSTLARVQEKRQNANAM